MKRYVPGRSLRRRLVAVALLVGCGKIGADDQTVSPDPVAASDAGAGPTSDGGSSERGASMGGPLPTVATVPVSLRVVHAVPNERSNFDFYSAGQTTPVASDVHLGQASAYQRVNIPVDGARFEVRVAGDPPLSVPRYRSDPLETVKEGVRITIVAGGKLLPVIEGFEPSPAANLRARFVNAEGGATHFPWRFYLQDGTELAALLQYNASSPEGVLLPAAAGPGDFIRLAMGKDLGEGRSYPPPASTFVYRVPDSIIKASAEVFMITFSGQLLAVPREGPAVLLANTYPNDPRLATLHAIPDLPRAVFTVNDLSGRRYLRNVIGLGENTGGGATVAGGASYTIAIAPPDGEQGPKLSVRTPILEDNRTYFAIVSGLAASTDAATAVRVSTYELEAAASCKTPVVGLIHAAPGLGAATLGVVDGDTFTPLLSNVAYGETTPLADRTPIVMKTTYGVRVSGSDTVTIVRNLDTFACQRVILLGGVGSSRTLVLIKG
jgi:hypothetical protein